MNGTELRDWMTRHRWSIHRLADELDVHASTIQRYRTGELKITRVVELAIETVERNG